MAIAMAAGVPTDLYDRETLVVRSRDFSGRWVNPTNELTRLAQAGIVRSVSHGYWLIPPAQRLKDLSWRPEVEAFGLALAVADYGSEAVALMGVSAARHHGAWPRAVAVAVIAVPRQRPLFRSPFGAVHFVKRATGRLATELTTTPLVTGSVTTVEQTILDLADRPSLGGVRAKETGESISALAHRVDWAEVLDLARSQRLHAAYVRARWVGARILNPPPPVWAPRKPVDGLGLMRPRSDDADFGIGRRAPK
jgi:predicted transcriptional regulator of viral defense system